MSTETAPAEVAEELSPAQQDAAQSIATPAPTPATDTPEPATTDEPKGDKPEFPKMVPVTALQAERQRRQQEAARARELEARIAQYEGKTQAQADDFPDLNQYKTLEEAQAGLRKWAESKAESQARETLTVKQHEQKQLALVDGFLSRTAEIAKDLPQIGQAVQAFGAMEGDFHPEVFQDIVADKDGPRIAWEIVTDSEFADKLMRATPLQAGRLIDQRLASAQKPKAPERPQVTATTTVSGAGGASKDPSQMSTAEYIAWREKQEN